MQEEIWKDIPNYEGLYQVSNLGRVKSLSRKVFNNRGFYILKHDKILKPGTSRDYLNVILYKDKIIKTFKIHKLVAICFLNHVSDIKGNIVVDHINNNPKDNRLENLQIITNRENLSKDKKNKTSKYTGVCWHKSTNKWRAKISINGKSFWLGVFDTQEQAHEAYKNKLKEKNI